MSKAVAVTSLVAVAVVLGIAMNIPPAPSTPAAPPQPAVAIDDGVFSPAKATFLSGYQTLVFVWKKCGAKVNYAAVIENAARIKFDFVGAAKRYPAEYETAVEDQVFGADRHAGFAQGEALHLLRRDRRPEPALRRMAGRHGGQTVSEQDDILRDAARQRVKELTAIFKKRKLRPLPDTADGRACLRLALEAACIFSVTFARRLAPELLPAISAGEIDAMIADIGPGKYRHRDEVALVLRVTEGERKALGLSTISSRQSVNMRRKRASNGEGRAA